MAILTITPVVAQQTLLPPRLVVMITVDQLRTDYLQYLSSNLGNEGFKRLMHTGVFAPNISFDYRNNLALTANCATLQTGSNPKQHGISFDSYYNTEEAKEHSILHDKAVLGANTQAHLSPRAILAHTISDELMITSKGQSRVYAIAPDAEEAIIGAGHLGTSALWIDDQTGQWCSSSYYHPLPTWISRMNKGASALSRRANTLSWEPIQATYKYSAAPYQTNLKAFRYTYPNGEEERFTRFKRSPLINEEISTMALELIRREQLGSNTMPDLLTINYYVGNPDETMGEEYSIEIQDAYIRLDMQLASLINEIDRRVGLINTVICLTGSGLYTTLPTSLVDERLPHGSFYPERCVALLNMYLMLIYGQENNWVERYENNQIFLNRKAAETEKIDLREMQAKAAEFVDQFSGVEEVTTYAIVYHGNTNDSREHFGEGIHKSQAGDLLIHLQPGWTVEHEESDRTTDSHKHHAVASPLFILGSGINPQKIERTIGATEVASTLSYIFRIRPPNAALSLPIPEITKQYQ